MTTRALFLFAVCASTGCATLEMLFEDPRSRGLAADVLSCDAELPDDPQPEDYARLAACAGVELALGADVHDCAETIRDAQRVGADDAAKEAARAAVEDLRP